jgi:hypothetical protein
MEHADVFFARVGAAEYDRAADRAARSDPASVENAAAVSASQ